MLLRKLQSYRARSIAFCLVAYEMVARAVPAYHDTVHW